MKLDHARQLRREQRSFGAGAGFTLIELLVVIGILALMLAVLLPALRGARRASQAVACASKQRQIGMAVRAYADASGGYIHRAQNGASWLERWAPPGEPIALRLINPNAAAAYWGAAYLPYLASPALVGATDDSSSAISRFAEKVWLCPSSVSTDPDFGNGGPDSAVSYGVNNSVTAGVTTVAQYVPGGPPPIKTVRWSRYARFKWPAEVIFCHDAVETRMEDRAHDTLSAYGGASNLTAWRPGGALHGKKQDAVYEYYRHSRQSQVLWLDGHVSAIRYSNGCDVPARWYEGS